MVISWLCKENVAFYILNRKGEKSEDRDILSRARDEQTKKNKQKNTLN